MRRSESSVWRFRQLDTPALQHFEREGFAVVESVLDDAAVRALQEAIAQASNSNAVHQRRGSTYGIRNLLTEIRALCELANSPPVRALVEPVLGREAIPVKGILFDKTPQANWKVAWHQDTTICVRERIEVPGFSAWSVKDGVLNVQPPDDVLSSIMAIRLHLDDCDADNGALRVLPGSHVAGRLSAAQIDQWCAERSAVTCEVGQGGALLLRPLTLHASPVARNPRHRRVIHLEFAAVGLPGGLAWVNSCPGTDRAAS